MVWSLCSWVLISTAKSLRPSSLAMTLRSSASSLGMPTVSTTTTPFDVAKAATAVDET